MNSKRDERDRCIFEWFGEDAISHYECPKCGDWTVSEPTYPMVCSCKFPPKKWDMVIKPDLSTPEGFFWLWPKMREDEKLWHRFILFVIRDSRGVIDYGDLFYNFNLVFQLIDNPSNFADAVEKFLKSLEAKSFSEWKEKGNYEDYIK